jgi:hypothetical protein
MPCKSNNKEYRMKKRLILAIGILLAALTLTSTASARDYVRVTDRTANVPGVFYQHVKVPKAKASHVTEAWSWYDQQSLNLANAYLCGHNDPGWSCFQFTEVYAVDSYAGHGPHELVEYIEKTPSGRMRKCDSNIYWTHETYFNYGNYCWLPY